MHNRKLLAYPNFFIAGAPKCGTSAMYRYLGDRDDVFVCEPKGPHYWSDDLVDLRRVHSEGEYLSLFSDASESHRAIGEASAMYLFSQVALPRIRQRWPESKVVVMLRDPVELAHAYHGQLLWDGQERVHDFKEAWILQSARARGEEVPRRCRCPRLLQYGAVAGLGWQIERLLRTFPKEQVKIILFDDFRRDPGAAYRAVLQFLELANDARDRFEPENVAKRLRIGALGQYITNQPTLARQGTAIVRHYLGVNRLGLRFLLKKAAPREKLTEAFVSELREFFREDIRTLSGLLGRDLEKKWWGDETSFTS